MLKYNLCPLCHFPAKEIINDIYNDCRRCGAIFLDKSKHLSQEKEKARYKTHNNNIYDKRYRKFVSPITSAVLREQNNDKVGLDFGCGTGPVISARLKESGCNILQYDPFFANDKEKLKNQYDYIVCCEVVEHFRDPKKEFKALKKLLKSGGSLYIMTDIYNNEIDFNNWYYRNDPTHVFIYRKKTLEYIKKKFDFKNLLISGRLIIFKN